jgi:ketosteroid isomerase-like protein
MDNKEVIRELFAAFARRDGEAMARYYHAQAVFKDPVFGELKSAEIAAMWKMLCARGKDLQIDLVSYDANGDQGNAAWEAKYTFSKTGKFVHNKIRSQFSFRDGLIASQTDDFDFWRWAKMALGTPGRWFGWTPLVRNAVRKEAKRSLQSEAGEARP